MFTREDLESKTAKELMQIAKELGVKRYEKGERLPKAELINSIMNGTTNDEPTTKKASKVVEEVNRLKEKEAASKDLTEEERAQKKYGYIEGAKIGTLVAFKSDTGKVKSAMIIKKSTKNKLFKLETKYGVQFIVSFDDIIWVRTNKRWPKGIYQLLKGICESEVSKCQQN